MRAAAKNNWGNGLFEAQLSREKGLYEPPLAKQSTAARLRCSSAQNWNSGVTSCCCRVCSLGGGASLAAVKFLVLEYAEHDRNLWLLREGEGQPRRGALGANRCLQPYEAEKNLRQIVKEHGNAVQRKLFWVAWSLWARTLETVGTRAMRVSRESGALESPVGESRECVRARKCLGGKGGGSPGPEVPARFTANGCIRPDSVALVAMLWRRDQRGEVAAKITNLTTKNKLG